MYYIVERRSYFYMYNRIKYSCTIKPQDQSGVVDVNVDVMHMNFCGINGNP